MKKLKLNVPDRLLLPQILPNQGGKIEIILANSILKKIEFSPDEISQYEMRDNNGNVTWSNGKVVDFEFTNEQIEILKLSSRQADEQKKITVQNLPLIEKIDAL